MSILSRFLPQLLIILFIGLDGTDSFQFMSTAWTTRRWCTPRGKVSSISNNAFQRQAAEVLSRKSFFKIPTTRLQLSLSEYTQSEKEEMRSMITMLSLEQSDDIRRAKVEELFDKEFCNRLVSDTTDTSSGNRNIGSLTDESATRFSYLFENILIEVGDEVKSRALENPTSSLTTTMSSSYPEDSAMLASNTIPSNHFLAGASAETQQVWALIDMMVQSKTILKRAKRTNM